MSRNAGDRTPLVTWAQRHEGGALNWGSPILVGPTTRGAWTRGPRP